MGGKCARNVVGPCTAAVSFNSTGRERDGRAVSPSVKPIFMRFPVLSKTKINFETEKFDVNMTQVWKEKTRKVNEKESKMKKCCCCLPLARGVCLIGGVTFFLSLALFVVYLVFIEDIRRYVLQDFYEIVPCSRPDIDCLVDSLFEYSLLANLLLVMM